MKKFIIPALTSALVFGGVMTTSAAQNPFSDIPKNHWAYKSIEHLHELGIVEGYKDGNYRSYVDADGKIIHKVFKSDEYGGQSSITRYEMAQMLARTLARIEGDVQLQGNKWTYSDDNGVTREVDENFSRKLSNGALVDKRALDEFMNLMIEFREELDTIGIKVKDLEDHSDDTKWTGELRYRYWNEKTDDEEKQTRNQTQFRIFPTAKIDSHWTAKSRFTASINMVEDTTTDAKMTFLYAEGKYDKLNIKLGKMPFFSTADGGLVMDEFFSGGQLTYGDKFKAKLEAGRWNLDNSNMGITDKSNYVGAELLYDDTEKFNFGVGYRHFKSDDFANAPLYGDKNKASIISVGAGYKFGDFELLGSYAKNTQADDFNKAYNIELDYAGADRNEPGSWGLYLGYRYAGDNVSFSPTFDEYEMRSNKKGVTFGATWSPFKNTYTEANYFHGKTLDTKEKTRAFFGRVSFFF